MPAVWTTKVIIIKAEYIIIKDCFNADIVTFNCILSVSKVIPSKVMDQNILIQELLQKKHRHFLIKHWVGNIHSISIFRMMAYISSKKIIVIHFYCWKYEYSKGQAIIQDFRAHLVIKNKQMVNVWKKILLKGE
jgi:hypothetical protein